MFIYYVYIINKNININNSQLSNTNKRGIDWKFSYNKENNKERAYFYSV